MHDLLGRQARIRKARRLATLLAALFAAAAVPAQTPGGRITGVLKDPSGAVVPGGRIEIKAVDTGLATSAATAP